MFLNMIYKFVFHKNILYLTKIGGEINEYKKIFSRDSGDGEHAQRFRNSGFGGKRIR